jgi:hypothetical protein
MSKENPTKLWKWLSLGCFAYVIGSLISAPAACYPTADSASPSRMATYGDAGLSRGLQKDRLDRFRKALQAVVSTAPWSPRRGLNSAPASCSRSS